MHTPHALRPSALPRRAAYAAPAPSSAARAGAPAGALSTGALPSREPASTPGRLCRRARSLERDCRELAAEFDDLWWEWRDLRLAGHAVDPEDPNADAELDALAGGDAPALRALIGYLSRVRGALDELHAQAGDAADAVAALDPLDDAARAQALELLDTLARGAGEFRGVLAECKAAALADETGAATDALLGALDALREDTMVGVVASLAGVAARLDAVLPAGGRALQSFPASARVAERGWRTTADDGRVLTLEILAAPSGARYVEAFALDAFGRVVEVARVVRAAPFRAGEWVECAFEQDADPAAFRIQMR